MNDGVPSSDPVLEKAPYELMGEIRKVPKLRGISHLIAFPFSIFFGLLLVYSAHDFKSKVAASVFTVSLATLFFASALFHRSPLDYKYRELLHSLDHSAIFILISGTYTSLCILALETKPMQYLLTFVWVGAIGGILKTFCIPHRHRSLTVVLYLILGWSIAPFAKDLVTAIGRDASLLVLLGGICYTVGAVIYARKYPDPWPDVFGYHEIFHVFVIAASIFHYSAIAFIIHNTA